MNTPIETKSAETKSAEDSTPYRDRLAEIRPALLAMSEEDIRRNLALDATTAAMIAEGGAKKAEPYRAALVARFGSEAEQVLTDTSFVAHATRGADIEVTTSQPSDDLSAM